jgi:hypothetical protein
MATNLDEASFIVETSVKKKNEENPSFVRVALALARGYPRITECKNPVERRDIRPHRQRPCSQFAETIPLLLLPAHPWART